MLAAFGSWVRDRADQTLNSTLEMARAHVVAVNAASEAAYVAQVPEEYLQDVAAHDGTNVRVIRRIVAAMKACIAGRCTLGETGLAPWAYPPASAPINGYIHFAGPAKALPSGKPQVTTFVGARPSPRAMV
jgi:hypothetical protein